MTRCATWPLGEQRAAVRCYTSSGTPIQCCGHGLLCCARHWLSHWQSDGVLHACDDVVPCTQDGALTWVGLPAVVPTACDTPAWLDRVLDAKTSQQVKDCALAGPADGYLVIELAEDTDLAAITPPTADLGKDTRRALIITCAVSPELARAGEQIHFRYFAPQYGVSEDAATGSAMRVLSPYWSRLGTELKALQCSPTGGVLYARTDGDHAWVGGQVEPII